MLKTLFKKSYKSISPNEARERLRTNKTAILLDVRSPAEYAELHIPNSKLLPLDKLQSNIAKIVNDKDTELIVHCHSGACAATACNLLSKMGYTNVSNLGGIVSWPYETESGK